MADIKTRDVIRGTIKTVDRGCYSREAYETVVFINKR